MVKPQFEVGKDRLGSGGVVRSTAQRAEVVAAVAACAQGLGAVVRGAGASPLPGPSGNVEYFLWLTKPHPGEDVTPRSATDLQDLADTAVAEGPTTS